MTTAVGTIPTDFANVWKKADAVGGWLKGTEASVLFQAAQHAPEGGNLVEIGSFRGRSTTVLASTGRELYAIDPMYTGSVECDNYTITEDDIDCLEDVIAEFDNATWFRMTTDEVSQAELAMIGPVSMLFIDGSHQPPHPINDFRALQGNLVDGAYVCFHDYGEYAAVGNAVGELEREGTIERLQITGSLYVGRLINGPPKTKKRVFIGLPYNSHIEDVTWEVVLSAILNQDQVEINAWRSRSSLLNSSFNECLCACHRHGDADYFLLLHSDLGIKGPFIHRMVQICEENGYDVLHAVAAIKNGEGLTSTAVAYSDDPWQVVRRITTKELKKLPEHFDIETLKREYDADAKILCPNTGILLMRYGDWLKDFPGFSNLDRIERNGTEWRSRVVPEDWLFGFWAAKNGVKVGGFNIATNHVGKHIFSTKDSWGHEVDLHWEKLKKRNYVAS